jgi:hypothetical protein
MDWLTLGLILLLLVQQVFWMVNVQSLMNKLMSRNYYEYVQADMLKSKSAKSVSPEEEDDYSDAQAEKANKLFGF